MDDIGGGYAITPWSDKDGEYLLFAPGWAYKLSFSKDIRIDGKEIAKEEKVDIDRTQFVFTCEGQEALMEVVQLSELPTLYVNTATGSLDFLRQNLYQIGAAKKWIG